jgi:hypothetical protein
MCHLVKLQWQREKDPLGPSLGIHVIEGPVSSHPNTSPHPCSECHKVDYHCSSVHPLIGNVCRRQTNGSGQPHHTAMRCEVANGFSEIGEHPVKSSSN